MVTKEQTPAQITASVQSFSPSINKRIISLHNSPRGDIFQCDQRQLKLFMMTHQDKFPKISVGTGKDGKPICSSMDSKKGREILLRNIRNVSVDENQIIAPVQSKSNCWFNTFFVTFFISDKGRKFFRYFREMMVTSKHADGRNIKPRLAKSFLILNACIEASYGNKNIALAMDTNKVIADIYRAIPRTKRYIDEHGNDYVRPVDRAGNPWSYYIAIMNFINSKDIKHEMFSANGYNQFKMSNMTRERLPELLVFRFHDKDCKDLMIYLEKLEIKTPNGEIGLYTLDSAIVRDTKERHFCSLATINGKQYGFDGASHSRMSQFNWREHIFTNDGVKREWTFKGSIFNKDPTNPIKWSFSKAYHLLFYYRVK